MMQQVYDVVNAAEYFQLYLDQYFPPAVGGVINDSVQSLLADELTPAEAAQEIQDAYLEHSN